MFIAANPEVHGRSAPWRMAIFGRPESPAFGRLQRHSRADRDNPRCGLQGADGESERKKKSRDENYPITVDSFCSTIR
jgi:hypothetical protein